MTPRALAGQRAPPPPPAEGLRLAIPDGGAAGFGFLAPLDGGAPGQGCGTPTPAPSLWWSPPEPAGVLCRRFLSARVAASACGHRLGDGRRRSVSTFPTPRGSGGGPAAPAPPANEAGAPRSGTLRAAPRPLSPRMDARALRKAGRRGAARLVRVAAPERFRGAKCFLSFGEPVAAPCRPGEGHAAIMGATRPLPHAAVQRAAEAQSPHGGTRGEGETGRRARPPAGELRGAPPPLRTGGCAADGVPVGMRRRGERRRRAPRRLGACEACIGRHASGNSWSRCAGGSALPAVALMVHAVRTRGLCVGDALGRL